MGGALGTRSKMRAFGRGLSALRESNLRLLESVRAHGGWSGMGPRGTRTANGRGVRPLGAAHDLNHLRQIDRILVWAYVSGSRLAANASASALSRLWR